MRIFLTLLVSLSVCMSFTQEEQQPGTAVSLELGGRNFLIGADVDFGIGQTRKHRLSAGLGIWGFGGGYGMYRYLFGQEKHFLELGAGSLFRFDPSEDESLLILNGWIGYRYHKNNGFVFRAGLTPSYDFTESDDPDYSPFFSLLPLGVSFGYSF